jgi:acetoin utilization deacetylase AcuC-like enzyme
MIRRGKRVERVSKAEGAESAVSGPKTKPPLLLTDPVFQEHDTGPGHPECSRRLARLSEVLSTHPVTNRFRWIDGKPATMDQLARIHDRRYIAAVAAYARHGGGRIEADTVVSRRSFEAASRASGAAITAVDEVLSGPSHRALVLARPPGHHALADAAMGFCLFNSVAVAAAQALDAHHLRRVLIVDFDVHHGNGTQDVFYQTDRVYFFSSHRYPFYPGSGTANETGHGAGLGATFNLPVEFGISRRNFLSAFEGTLTDAAAKCQPELLLVSAGFDAHAADPIGSLGLETEDFAAIGKLLIQTADHYCGGRIVSLLEGGYHIEKLAESVTCYMEVLAGG